MKCTESPHNRGTLVTKMNVDEKMTKSNGFRKIKSANTRSSFKHTRGSRDEIERRRTGTYNIITIIYRYPRSYYHVSRDDTLLSLGYVTRAHGAFSRNNTYLYRFDSQRRNSCDLWSRRRRQRTPDRFRIYTLAVGGGGVVDRE